MAAAKKTNIKGAKALGLKIVTPFLVGGGGPL